MSLLTDADWLIRQLRIQLLLSEDHLAERIVSFPFVQEELSYLTNSIAERNLCYSPNITTITSDGVSAANHKTGRSYNLKDETVHAAGKLQFNLYVVGVVSYFHRNPRAEADGQDSSKQAIDSSPAAFNPSVVLFPKEPIHKNASSSSHASLRHSSALPPNQTISKKVSMLSSLIHATSSSTNPFGEKYSYICGKGESNPIELKIFFPLNWLQSKQEPLHISVKREATVEEVIGYALYEFVEKKLEPAFIDEIKISTSLLAIAVWNLRIVEDDGSIDEDFPGVVVVMGWLSV